MPIKSKKIEKYVKQRITVRLYDAIDSTNNEAKRRAQQDHEGIFLYVTDCQTAGRGRRGHDFYSPKGSGLYFTLALPVSGDPADIQMVTCAAAVAVCEAIAALSSQQPQIKWVNDIYINGKKVAGILAELVLDADNKPLSVIVGIGINLTTRDFPTEFAERAGSVGDLDPNRLCAEATNRLTEMYRTIQYNSNFELIENYYSDIELKCAYNSIIEKYKQLNFCIDQEITYTDVSGIHTATAVDIAPDGSLIVTENGIKKSLHSGEISIRSRS